MKLSQVQYRPAFLSAVTLAVFSALLIQACQTFEKIHEPVRFNEADRANYRDASLRDGERLQANLAGTTLSQMARAYSWTALSHSKNVNGDELLSMVMADDSKEAWAALSFHKLSMDNRRSLRKSWLTHSQAGICRVLAAQGDLNDARWLMEAASGESNASESSVAAGVEASEAASACAIAVGVILNRSQATQQDILAVSERIYALSNQPLSMPERGSNVSQSSSQSPALRSQTIRGLLYTFSRSDRHRPTPKTDSEGKLRVILNQSWDAFGVGLDPFVDAWMLRSLGVEAAEKVSRELEQSEFHAETVRAVEMARIASKGGFSSESAEQMITSWLLSHPNPIVGILYMDEIAEGRVLPESVRSLIEQTWEQTNDDEVWLSALSSLTKTTNPDGRTATIQAQKERIHSISDQNPYLIERALPLLATVNQPYEMLLLYRDWTEKGGLQGLFAVRDLFRLWVSSKEKTPELTNSVRELTRFAMQTGDRSMAYSVEPLLMDDFLFPPTRAEGEWILTAAREYSLPEDIEVYQALGRVLEEKWPTLPEIRPFLASYQSAEAPKVFRQPDWERLEHLGRSPHWVIELELGRIVMELDPASAPFTVSAIDSLTSTGAYDGVPFHRLAHNFVIQGGDVESGDGFGGPDFIIPTEGSSNSFTRGAVGIASAGPDTEGSQYFIMIDWAPHLDGRYTLFGRVVEGMDVVDRVRIGDRVTRAYMR